MCSVLIGKVISDNSVVFSQKNNKEKTLIDKLRWVTLGYHHDWATKVICSTNSFNITGAMHFWRDGLNTRFVIYSMQSTIQNKCTFEKIDTY